MIKKALGSPALAKLENGNTRGRGWQAAKDETRRHFEKAGA